MELWKHHDRCGECASTNMVPYLMSTFIKTTFSMVLFCKKHYQKINDTPELLHRVQYKTGPSFPRGNRADGAFGEAQQTSAQR